MDSPKPSKAALKRHELLQGVEDHARQLLIDHGVAEDVADQAAIAIADHLATDWRGQVIVIPADYHWKIAERDIYFCTNVYDGDIAALAKAAGMTQSGAYKMLSRYRRYLANARQGKLFD